MKPVFIQSWTIPRKYLRSVNLPIAMSQTVAMKMSRFLPKKAHSTRNNDAFTHYGISLIFPNTLHQKYSGSLNSFMFYFNFYFIGKAAPSLVQFSGEWPKCEGVVVESELLYALKQTKNSSAPGCDGITVEFLKMFRARISKLLTLFNSAFENGNLSSSQKKSCYYSDTQRKRVTKR